MSKQVRLVFFGEVLPGADPAAARQNLARALRADPAQADLLFSGQRVVIKPELPEAEAARYIAHLAGLGVQVIAEPIAPAPPPPSPFASSPTAPRPAGSPFASAPTPVPGLAEGGKRPAGSADTVTCPACGTVQPRRNLCIDCGANMQGLIDAKKEETEFNAEVRKAEAEIKARQKRGEAPAGSEEEGAVPKVFGLDFGGRMGRVTYFLTGLVIFAIAAALGVVSAIAQSIALFVVMFVAGVFMIVVNVRAMVLRCHDLNWSGWMALLSLVPVVNIVFALIQLFVPGTAGTNRYGERPGRSPTRHVMYALGFFVALGGVAGYAVVSEGRKMQERALLEMQESMAQAARVPPTPSHREAVAEAPPPEPVPATNADGRKMWDGSINTIVIYTVGDCQPCLDRPKELKRIGLWPREVRADLNEPASEEMVGKMVKAGLPISSMQMPVIDVNGTILNNPSVEQVEKFLR